MKILKYEVIFKNKLLILVPVYNSTSQSLVHILVHVLAGREFRKIGHLVTSFYNFAWCYIYVYCFQKTPQTKWGSPLAACMHTIQNGQHPVTTIAQLLLALDPCVISFFMFSGMRNPFLQSLRSFKVM